MSYRKVSKQEARRRFDAGEPIILCPCKFVAADGGWQVHHEFSADSIAEFKDGAARYDPAVYNNPVPANCWAGSVNQTAWDLMHRNWSFYNTNYELGYYAHYYVRETA